MLPRKLYSTAKGSRTDVMMYVIYCVKAKFRGALLAGSGS